MCFPPYIIKWIVVSFLLEAPNRHNRLASACPLSNLSPVFGPSLKSHSEEIENRKTLVKKSNFLSFCLNTSFSDLI